MSSVEWETPQDFFDALNKEFHFEIDVAASEENFKCGRFYGKESNSLEINWGIWKSIWLNPPYDKSIGLWLRKAYESAQDGCTIVCLIQGRSCDTKWWHDYIMKSSEIRFIKDRLHFGLNGKFSRANISSLIVVFRPHCTGPPRICSINTQGEKI